MHAEFGEQGEGRVPGKSDRFGAYPARGARSRPVPVTGRTYAPRGGASIVELARTVILARIDSLLVAEALAAALMVSESTLRRVVHAETGLRLSVFMLNLRLDQAHAWLSSDKELRSQQQITLALGLHSAQAFSRAYREKFGESIVETRRRAISQISEI